MHFAHVRAAAQVDEAIDTLMGSAATSVRRDTIRIYPPGTDYANGLTLDQYLAQQSKGDR